MPDRARPRLTPTQWLVLERLAAGDSNAAIGRVREANRRVLASNPASGTYTDSSGAGRKAALLDTWDKEHAGLQRLTPGLFAERRKAYEQSITTR